MLCTEKAVIAAVEKDPNSDIGVRTTYRLYEDEASDLEIAKRQQLMSKDIVTQISSKATVDRVLEISSNLLGSVSDRLGFLMLLLYSLDVYMCRAAGLSVYSISA